MFRKTKRLTDRQTNKQTFGAEIGSENKPVGPASQGLAAKKWY